jgi:hypothetical protein
LAIPVGIAIVTGLNTRILYFYKRTETEETELEAAYRQYFTRRDM